MAKLKIEKPERKNQARGPIKGLLIILLLFVVAAVVYAFIPANQLPPLEVENFSGNVEIYNRSTRSWEKIERGQYIQMGDKLRSGKDGEINLELPGEIRVRVKQNSEFGFLGPKPYDKNPYMRLNLEDGEMFIATQKGFSEEKMDFVTPQSVIQTSGGYFRVQTNSETNKSSVGLMRGKAQVRKNEFLNEDWISIKGLETLEVDGTGIVKNPTRVTRDEWNLLREIYELTLKSAASEAEQLDISKEAGTFFNYVFDHGTFYTPKFGYAGRDFFKEETSGEILLEVEYDVFPRGSFVGVYIKTRELNLMDYDFLELETRRVDEEGSPMNVKIELKSKSNVVRSFAIKQPQIQWEKQVFPLRVKKETLSNEMTLVFIHDRVGEDKKGALQLRNINLVKDPERARIGEPAKQPLIERAQLKLVDEDVLKTAVSDKKASVASRISEFQKQIDNMGKAVEATAVDKATTAPTEIERRVSTTTNVAPKKISLSDIPTLDEQQ
jgi:hypothetical protein